MLALVVPCIADESTEAADTIVDAEEATDAVVVPEDAEKPAEEATDASDEVWESFKTKITDTATWTMIGTAILTILTVLATVKKAVVTISDLVGKKADNDTIKEEIKKMKDAFKDDCNVLSEMMENYESNEQKLYAIFTLFMTNCKISESAKTEILNILSGVKKYEGSPAEIVAKAQESIDKAKEESDTGETPTLDALVTEEYMDLG
jgi:hypothetical protein